MIKQIYAKLNSFFELDENKTTVRTEVLAGITTFITVAYILILNPQILSHPYEIMGEMDMAARISNGVFIGTCLASFVGTILCAVYAKVPFVQAPGMGLNAFFCLYRGAGHGIHLFPVSGRGVHFRRIVYRYYQSRSAGGHYPCHS